MVGVGESYVKVGRNFQYSNVKNIRHFLNFQNCFTNDLSKIELAIYLDFKIVQNSLEKNYQSMNMYPILTITFNT